MFLRELRDWYKVVKRLQKIGPSGETSVETPEGGQRPHIV